MHPNERFRFVDQEARDLANRAIALIEGHERVCAQATKASADWREGATATFDRIEESVTGIYTRIWLAAGGLVVGMFAVIMALLFKH